MLPGVETKQSALQHLRLPGAGKAGDLFCQSSSLFLRDKAGRLHRVHEDLDLGDEGKSFSGTATYETSFTLDKSQIGKDLVLDLGKVDFIADIKINGKSAGVLWTEPYSLNIKDFIQEGENTLTVDVTGTWYNRLAYDASQPEPQRKTWTIAGPAAGSQLHDSGLLGPVRIEY